MRQVQGFKGRAAAVQLVQVTWYRHAVHALHDVHDLSTSSKGTCAAVCLQDQAHNVQDRPRDNVHRLTA